MPCSFKALVGLAPRATALRNETISKKRTSQRIASVGVDFSLKATPEFNVSDITPDTSHTLRLRLSGIDTNKLQGVFFDNVEPELTTQLSRDR